MLKEQQIFAYQEVGPNYMSDTKATPVNVLNNDTTTRGTVIDTNYRTNRTSAHSAVDGGAVSNFFRRIFGGF